MDGEKGSVAEKTSRTLLVEEASRLRVASYSSHQDFLRDVYQAVKHRLDGYSYTKFADDLGFSKTNVIRLVIAGQRPLTTKAAAKIATHLNLKGAARKYWLTLVNYSNARRPAEREQFFRELIQTKAIAAPRSLDPRLAEYFGEWYHPVIREMAALKDFDGDPLWIKKRLTFPLRIDAIKQSLDLLVKLGALRYDKIKNLYSRSDEQIATDRDVDDMALVRFHQQMITAGREAITRVDENEREVRAITATLPKDKVPLIKAKIIALMHEILEMEGETEIGDEVYQMNVQLFPFTKK